MQGDVAFIKVRDEFRTKPCCAPAGETDQDNCAYDDGVPGSQSKPKRRAVGGFGAAHDPAFLLRNFSAYQ